MRNTAFITLCLFLTSCSEILFYDIQSCGGEEINEIPTELFGTWLSDTGDTLVVVNNKKEFDAIGIGLVSLDGINVKCFKKDDFYILNHKSKSLWNVTIIKILPEGNFNAWPLDFLWEAKILAEIPELKLIGWIGEDNIWTEEDNIFRRNRFLIANKKTEFSEARIDGEISSFSLDSITSKINPFVVKKSKTVFFPQEFFNEDYNTIYPK